MLRCKRISGQYSNDVCLLFPEKPFNFDGKSIAPLPLGSTFIIQCLWLLYQKASQFEHWWYLANGQAFWKVAINIFFVKLDLRRSQILQTWIKMWDFWIRSAKGSKQAVSSFIHCVSGIKTKPWQKKRDDYFSVTSTTFEVGSCCTNKKWLELTIPYLSSACPNPHKHCCIVVGQRTREETVRLKVKDWFNSTQTNLTIIWIKLTWSKV